MYKISAENANVFVESHSFRNEKKYSYKWTIHEFDCNATLEGEVLPSVKFEFECNTDFRFIGELSISGTSCSTRRCQLTLNTTPCQEYWKVYAKLGDEGFANKMITANLHEKNKTLCLDLYNNMRECFLAKSNYVILCEIKFVDYTKSPTPKVFQEQKSTLRRDLFELFKNKKYWDVTFVVKGEELHAHKCILVSRSKVFSAMFEYEMKESKSNKVTIEDINAEVFEEILRYIYTDEVEKMDKLAAELLVASDKYDLSTLRINCENHLINNTTIETAADTLILADLYGLQQLRAHVIRLIRNNSKAVTCTYGWQKLASNYAHLVAELYLEIIN